MKKILLLTIAFLLFLTGAFSQSYIITTVAGTGAGGFSGDGGQATAAQISLPEGVNVDAFGNMYIADYGNNRIRKVSVAGVISEFCGTGVGGYSGDGGQATAAQIDGPCCLNFDAAGNCLIADWFNERVRKVTVGTGIITTVAGNGVTGFSGDGGQATAAEFDLIFQACVDNAGNILITDTYNSRIRKVTTGTGIITTIAGTGVAGFSGDGGQATAAKINDPCGVAVDAAGDIFIADMSNDRIRKILPSGVISTIGGNGIGGYSGDGGPATAAEMNLPVNLCLDATGNVFVSDMSGNRIRLINPAGIISTVAGNGVGSYCCDGGPATAAEISGNRQISMYGSSIYIADLSNNRIRMLTNVALPISLLSFTAEYIPATNNVQLNWATASEKNNKVFTVERTSDNEYWETVATVPGAGNSSQTLYYSAVDENVMPGTTYYYRLMQTDYDGNYSYSDVVPVNIPLTNHIEIYPNPVADNLNLRYSSESTEAVTVRIFDMKGAQAMPEYNESNVASGLNNYTLNTSALAKGIYILVLSSPEHTFYQKFVKE